eukprot:CAMPEP_0172635902 /NCGR_PEP_ID=MMETSP1068-20121228/201520_1 /TAXON_ID=35684 /ORGANISM="Pseudopedinella elastica, Strain CCMP716" /LENGTH=308 /DNA_ID=CAMNT_0013448235 /DNA_START=180 /DNA_END=1103 /DNA_ORIENTATION=-
MGAGASLLHEEDYEHFLELGPVEQYKWLRKIPKGEVAELMERTKVLDSHDRINILKLLRQSNLRGLVVSVSDEIEAEAEWGVDSDEESEPEPLFVLGNEILVDLVDRQKDQFSGNVTVLQLVSIGLEFNLRELSSVLTPNLRTLNLSRNQQLSGDISQLAACAALFEVCLEGTAVKGDVSAFYKCPKLHKILLSGLAVTGDVQVFAPCVALKKVWLRETKVHGDVKVFSKCRQLVDLLLRRTKVSGNLKALEKCIKLQNLSLSRTQVSGSVVTFRNFKNLKHLSLEFCPGLSGMTREELEYHLPNCAV